MIGHPQFQEIVETVFPKTVDPTYFRMAAQVNAHLCACEECKKVYDILLAARNEAEDIYFKEAYPDR